MTSETYKKIRFVIVSVIIAFAIALYFSSSNPDEQAPNYKEKYDSIQSLLNEQSQERLVFIRSIDSINSINQLLHLQLTEANQELQQVDGRYDNHTPSELEIEMERRANDKK